MRRAYKVKVFARWARKVGLPDAAIWKALREMELGLIDAELGGGLYKKRVALHGRGKRGSARMIVACKHGGHWYLLAGFNKNDKADFDPHELDGYRVLAEIWFGFGDEQVALALRQGDLKELEDEEA